jgi:hypothetical protein
MEYPPMTANEPSSKKLIISPDRLSNAAQLVEQLPKAGDAPEILTTPKTTKLRASPQVARRGQ